MKNYETEACIGEHWPIRQIEIHHFADCQVCYFRTESRDGKVKECFKCGSISIIHIEPKKS